MSGIQCRFNAVRAAFFVVLVLAGILGSQAAMGQEQDWTGEWQTFWHDGQAVMTLDQDGDRVSGTYQPGNGKIEGSIQEDGTFRGAWEQTGARGGFIFAMSDDGSAFSGRYDNGEYWNGRRVEDNPERVMMSASFAPRVTLRSIAAAASEAVYEGNIRAARIYNTLLEYEGETEDARDRNARRRLLWQIIDLSTFRIFEAPGRPEGNTAEFEIGPVDRAVTYTLRFRQREAGSWVVLVDDVATLEATLKAFLDAMGHPSYASARIANENSPRGTMRRFLLGMANWDSGGAAAALQTLDLSYLPVRLQDIEGPIVADYLRHVLDRIGYVIWQEVPNDPNQQTPYVHYRHPFGSIVIERQAQDEGEPAKWAFSAATLQTVPDLFAAIQRMPEAEGLSMAEPVTQFFQLRETIRNFSPILLQRNVEIENWQWIALALAILAAILAAWIAAAVWALILRLTVSGQDSRDRLYRSLAWPLRFASGGTVLLFLLGNLGLLHSGFGYGGRIIALLAAVSVTALIYQVIGVIGGFFVNRAEATPGYVDDIVWSLSTGLAKLIVIIGGIFVSADVIGLPYEGVITGLGVGGVALAFAARDTVSNMLGGAILMTDRPFKRGDLVATHDELATVESVGLRSTRLRTLTDSVLIVPNSQLVDTALVNWGERRRRRFDLGIGLTYDTPREKLDIFVTRLREIYMDQPQSDKTTCYLGLKGFGASSIDIEFRGFFVVATYDAQVEAQHKFVGDVIDLAAEVGVSFAFPTRTVHLETADRPAPAAGGGEAPV